jgi:MFS family permease
MQVPTGILADRWGPRRLLTAGAAVAAAGTLLFALSPSYFWTGAGRLLIGASVAVAFVGMLKLASHWLPVNQFSIASGMALFCGIVGAVFAGVPLRLLIDAFGWRPVMVASAVVTALVAAAIWWVVRDDPSERGYASHTEHPGEPHARGSVWHGLRRVIGYRNIRLLFFIPGGLVGAVLTFSGLWGVPYLTSVYALPATEAAGLTSLLLVSWAIGGPLFGALSDRSGRRKPLYLAGTAIALAGWCVLVLAPPLPLWLLAPLLAVIGFATGAMIISFAFAKESVPAHLAGTASGVANMGVMIGPMILQPAVGALLDLTWEGRLVDGVRIYGETAYRVGFALMIAWLVLGLLLLALTRETGNGAPTGRPARHS